jgi:hypothetical protein
LKFAEHTDGQSIPGGLETTRAEPWAEFETWVKRTVIGPGVWAGGMVGDCRAFGVTRVVAA